MGSQGTSKAALMPPAARSAQYKECDQTQALSRLCDTSSLLELWHALRMHPFAVSPPLAAHLLRHHALEGIIFGMHAKQGGQGRITAHSSAIIIFGQANIHRSRKGCRLNASSAANFDIEGTC